MSAAYDSLRAVGSLFLTNADFRLFASDLATVGRQIFSDTAFSLSGASQEVGEQLKPSQEEEGALKGAGADEGRIWSTDEARQKAGHAADITGKGAARTGSQAVESTKGHLSGEQRETLLHRLKRAVLRLRERSDYSDSVSTLSQLLQRYARAYASAAESTVSAAEEDVDVNADVKQAMRHFWILVQSLGDPKEWRILEQRFHDVLKHAYKDPDFEKLMSETGNFLQEMLTDPGFFDSGSDKIGELREKTKQLGSESGLRQDLDAFLEQAKRALHSVHEDIAIRKLVDATRKVYDNVSNAYHDRKSHALENMAHVLLPLLLRNVQNVPIPRLEISSPEMDLLLENLILEPGHTVNSSSFLPYRIHVTSRSDFDILKQHSKRATTDLRTTFTATVLGLNISASHFSYWLHSHSGPFLRYKDEGVASFYLDRRGFDISLDVEVGRERLEHIFILRGVRVVIHKLDYQIHQSKWRFLLWLTKPFLKHQIRRVIEKKIAEEIVGAAVAVNRELVFARERLRAARIANPKDVASFVRAVLARMKPSDSNVETHVGIDESGSNVFKGIYTPGSVSRLWHEEAQRAQEAAAEQGVQRAETWRSDLFDVGRR